MNYRNDNQIAADIKSLVDGFIRVTDALSGWETVQMYQRVQDADMDKVVRFFTVTSNRMGWQGRENAVMQSDGKMYRTERWRETRRVQFDCLKARKNSDTTSTITAVDAARLLIAFFNGFEATQAMKNLGYNRLELRNLRVPVEFDDTDRFRVWPGFDLILVYDQELTMQIPATDKLAATGIYPI